MSERIPLHTNLGAFHNGHFKYCVTLNRDAVAASAIMAWCVETMGEPLLKNEDEGYSLREGARWDGVSNAFVFKIYFMEAPDTIQFKMAFGGVMMPTNELSPDE